LPQKALVAWCPQMLGLLEMKQQELTPESRLRVCASFSNPFFLQ